MKACDRGCREGMARAFDQLADVWDQENPRKRGKEVRAIAAELREGEKPEYPKPRPCRSAACANCGHGWTTEPEPAPAPIEAGDLWQRDEDGTPVVIEAWDGDRVDFATIDDSGVGVLNTPSFRDTFTLRPFHRDHEASDA